MYFPLYWNHKKILMIVSRNIIYKKSRFLIVDFFHLCIGEKSFLTFTRFSFVFIVCYVIDLWILQRVLVSQSLYRLQRRQDVSTFVAHFQLSIVLPRKYKITAVHSPVYHNEVPSHRALKYLIIPYNRCNLILADDPYCVQCIQINL